MPSPSVPPAPHIPSLDLGGRTALVTGAAGGIGRACALRLAAAGAKVRAGDRDAAGLDALAELSAGVAGTPQPPGPRPPPPGAPPHPPPGAPPPPQQPRPP